MNRIDTDFISKRMAERGLTFSQLEAKGYGPKSSLARLGNGKMQNPRLSTLIKLATALDCSISDLVIEGEKR